MNNISLYLIIIVLCRPDRKTHKTIHIVVWALLKNHLASIIFICIIQYRDRYARELIIIYVHTLLSIRVGAILSSRVPPTHDERGEQ